MADNIDSVKRAFEIFGKGVERLEELNKILKSLNTKGFEQEAKEIEADIHNVAAIPRIEKKLEALKEKINGKYPGKSKPDNGNEAKISKIMENVPELKQDKGMKHNVLVKPLSSAELHNLYEIPKIGKSLEELKLALSSVKAPNRVAAIPPSIKKGIEEIPKIEAALEKLRQAIEAKGKKIPSGEVDRELSNLVGENLGEFIHLLKFGLSRKLRKKEEELEKEFRLREEKAKNELNLEREKLRQSLGRLQKKLEKDFDEKFQREVRKKLASEVKKKLNKLLDERLGSRKRELETNFMDKLKEKEKTLKATLEKELKVVNQQRQILEARGKRLEAYYLSKFKVKESSLRKNMEEELNKRISIGVAEKLRYERLKLRERLAKLLAKKVKIEIEKVRKKLKVEISAAYRHKMELLEENLRKEYKEKADSLQKQYSDKEREMKQKISLKFKELIT